MPSSPPAARLVLAASLSLALSACGDRSDASGSTAKSTAAAKSSTAAKSSAQAEGSEPDTGEQPEPARPKLIVVVVVDQMRADYLTRFGDEFEGGLARLRAEGRLYSHATHQHAMTETAPGHATIATGEAPSVHGVISNSWYDPAIGLKVNAVDDPGATIFGHADAHGVSPARLLRESVGDWMQASDPASVVVAISLKDRASILLGGKHPDAAVWYDDVLGGYTSSKYYGEAPPSWVTRYNELERAAALYGDEGWTLMRAADSYGDSRLETNPKVVTTFNDYSLTKRFPHVIDVEGKQPRNVVRDTPFGDQMTLELALAAITTEKMGADAVPDLLLLSMSAGDYAGHRYGPDSVEIHDYFLRLDQNLGHFFVELDNALGLGSYVVLLTSDHGVAPMPEYSTFTTAGRFVGKVEVPPMLAAATKAAGVDQALTPRMVYTHGPHLEFSRELDEPTRARIRNELATLARAHPLLADAWTREELLDPGSARTPYANAYRRSFHPDRSPDLLFQLAEGVATYPEGTNHGTPYAYDQHVPLIVFGAGTAGVYAEPVHTVDIAPTIAGLVGVEAPAGIDGEPLPLD